MKRDQILENYNKANAKIQANKELIEKSAYHTCKKYIEGFGRVAEITSPENILKAYKKVMKNFKSSDECAKEIGLKIESVNETYLGYSKDEWLEDFKTASSVANARGENRDLTAIVNKLSNHLSEDDKFSLDMQSLNLDLLNEAN